MGHCCQRVETSNPVEAWERGLQWKRSTSLLGWVLPTAVLTLVPKCPVCVAAYVAVFTGIGLSITAATYLRTAVIVVAVAILCAMCVRQVIAHGRRFTAADRDSRDS